MTAPDGYPASWAPKGAPTQAETQPAPVEAIALAIDAYIAALSPEDLDSLLIRTRG